MTRQVADTDGMATRHAGPAILLLCFLMAPAAGADAPPPPKGEFRILLATADPARGKRFQAFFEHSGISCTAVAYQDVTTELLDRHDLFMPDSPDGQFKDVAEKTKGVRPKNVPMTEKPIFAIGYMGYSVLSKYGIALGLVKT